jgi:hypothetical protein
MALFSDGPICGIEDLAAHDSQLLDVAGTEGIDVGRKLALAQEEVGLELQTLLSGIGDLRLDGVVVTPALRQWHAFHTLEIVYRDACNSQLNDRYARKQQGFREMARWAREKLREAGVGIAATPLPRAETPMVEAVAGSLGPGTYYVTSCWVNRAGEAGASAIPAVATIGTGGMRVRMHGGPANATGWNVYVGTTPETMARQNAATIAKDRDWVQPGAIAPGAAPGTGQQPTYMQPLPRILQRG